MITNPIIHYLNRCESSALWVGSILVPVPAVSEAFMPRKPLYNELDRAGSTMHGA